MVSADESAFGERQKANPVRGTRDGLIVGGVEAPAPDRVVAPDSAIRVLLAATARGLRGRDCGDLGHESVLSRLRSAPEPIRRAATTRAAGRTAIPVRQAGEIDAERVAHWIVEHYPPARLYPGAVIGSAHGAAAHLAVALGVPWLPAAFEMTVHWPRGAVDDPFAARNHGAAVAARLVAANPDIHVRQVHDPAGRGVLAGATVTLLARWHRLPGPYRRFLATRLVPSAPIMLLRDVRTWPVLESGDGHSFQVGAPASGLEPDDFRVRSEPLGQVLRAVGGEVSRWNPPAVSRIHGDAEHAVEPGFEAGLRYWAESSGRDLHRVIIPRPEVLSAATADVYRSWLRGAGKSGDRCVVECGRMIDPWQVVRAGLVPYWCENATARSVAGAEWWLAGSTPFSSVDVLPESPGLRSPALAGLPQWLSVAAFGQRRRSVDRGAARGYPVNPLPTRHATDALRAQPYDLPAPAPLQAVDVLAGLRDRGTAGGLLVC